MCRKVAIVQSNYIPWKGYFDLINLVDEFVLYDDVQYTKRDWRNRNRIKTPDGLAWLTIPVVVKGKYHQKIKDVLVSDTRWNIRHWKSICQNYAQARFFDATKIFLEELYTTCDRIDLSGINYHFLAGICNYLGITTKLSWSMDYDLAEGKTERLIGICKQANASEYISGPSARQYINEGEFQKEGIELTYIDYSGYPVYDQLYPPFEHGVSIVDLLLNTGPDAKAFMKSF